MDIREQRRLVSWASGFGLELSASQIRLINIYLDELWAWNRKMNLIGVKLQKRMINELLMDSLLPCSFLQHKGKLLDVGSGAGFPAIPLKICKANLTCHLVEANSKKVSFLRHVIRLMELKGIEVIQGRVENEGTSLSSGGYQIITARALASLDQVLQWCAPHLKPGGTLVCFLGRYAERILGRSSGIITANRLLLLRRIPYQLPGRGQERSLVFFRKCQ